MAADINTIAAVSTAVAVVVALVLGIIQVRQANRQRADALALEALRFAEKPETARAMDLVLALPEGLRAAELDREPQEVREAVTLIEFTLSTLAWMVHRRMVPLHDLDDLMGGVVRASWRRLRLVALDRRMERGSQSPFEWVEWLHDRLEADPSPAKAAGMHVAYRDWDS